MPLFGGSFDGEFYNRVIDGGRSVGKASADVFRLQPFIVGEDFRFGHTSGQQSEDVRNAHAITPDARLAAAFSGFDGDT